MALDRELRSPFIPPDTKDNLEVRRFFAEQLTAFLLEHQWCQAGGNGTLEMSGGHPFLHLLRFLNTNGFFADDQTVKAELVDGQLHCTVEIYDDEISKHKHHTQLTFVSAHPSDLAFYGPKLNR